MTQGMQATQEIIARIFAQRGYVEHLNRVGVWQIDKQVDDLAVDQANTIHVCASDPQMLGLIESVFARYEELKAEHNLSAKPWYDDYLET